MDSTQFLYIVLSFLAGGYIIPASMIFQEVWKAECKAEDDPTFGEKFLTALLSSLMWPMVKTAAVSTEEFERNFRK